MSDTYIIEVQSAAAGLVIRDHGGFRFFSADAAFAELEGLLFPAPSDAENAALGHRRAPNRPIAARRGHA